MAPKGIHDKQTQPFSGLPSSERSAQSENHLVFDIIQLKQNLAEEKTELDDLRFECNKIFKVNQLQKTRLRQMQHTSLEKHGKDLEEVYQVIETLCASFDELRDFHKASEMYFLETEMMDEKNLELHKKIMDLDKRRKDILINPTSSKLSSKRRRRGSLNNNLHRPQELFIEQESTRPVRHLDRCYSEHGKQYLSGRRSSMGMNHKYSYQDSERSLDTFQELPSYAAQSTRSVSRLHRNRSYSEHGKQYLSGDNGGKYHLDNEYVTECSNYEIAPQASCSGSDSFEYNEEIENDFKRSDSYQDGNFVTEYNSDESDSQGSCSESEESGNNQSGSAESDRVRYKENLKNDSDINGSYLSKCQNGGVRDDISRSNSSFESENNFEKSNSSCYEDYTNGRDSSSRGAFDRSYSDDDKGNRSYSDDDEDNFNQETSLSQLLDSLDRTEKGSMACGIHAFEAETQYTDEYGKLNDCRSILQSNSVEASTNYRSGLEALDELEDSFNRSSGNLSFSSINSEQKINLPGFFDRGQSLSKHHKSALKDKQPRGLASSLRRTLSQDDINKASYQERIPNATFGIPKMGRSQSQPLEIQREKAQSHPLQGSLNATWDVPKNKDRHMPREGYFG